MKHPLVASIASSDPHRLFDQITAWPDFRDAGPASTVGIGHAELAPNEWRSIRTARISGIAFWDGWAKQLSITPRSDLVTVAIPGSFLTVGEVIARVGSLPFYLTAFGKLWRDRWKETDGYEFIGFGRSMILHGWGCAFRGTGHDRLVSRRWLDFGPWRVIRRPDDTTFLQFHDLAITDPDEAYAQAKPAHERMGISPTGGYIAWHYQALLDGAAKAGGLFQRETRTLELVVAPGIEVTQGQMLNQCARRLQQRLLPPSADRIERIAYVFMDKQDARAHLHELWLRELECWYVDGRGKHRLDADYRPAPMPPAWVKNLKNSGPNAV